MATFTPGALVELVASPTQDGIVKAVDADSVKVWLYLTQSDGQSNVYWTSSDNVQART